MQPDEFIAQSIKNGESFGFDALNDAQRIIFAISEAEVLCCMEGIDSLVDHYGPAKMSFFSDAFRSIGAVRIAETLSLIAASPEDCENELTLANQLITELDGYSYENIRLFVEKYLKSNESGGF